MTTTYEPMDITIITSDRSSWPEPTCDPDWPRIKKLQWTAGVIKARTGVEVRFNDGSSATGPGYAHQFPEIIGVNVRREGGWSSSSQMDWHIDQYLRGIEDGALAMRS